RCPGGSSSRAAALVATVPITVTTFGLTRRRTSRCASGPNTAAVTPRPWLPRTIDPPAGQLAAGAAEQLRQCAGVPDDRQEVGVAAPPGHHVLVHVPGNTGTGHRPGVHAQVETVARLHLLQRAHRRCRQLGHLRTLRGGHRGQVRYVPVRADEQVPRVVRVEVEHHVAGLTPADHERLLIPLARCRAERAPRPGAVIGGLVLPVDVGHPVRRPQPVVPVRDRRMLLRALHAQTCTRVAIASVMVSIASWTGTPLRWLPSRNRQATAPASASSPPALRMKGTFCFVAERSFLLNRSSEVSTSARTPAARSRATTSPR